MKTNEKLPLINGNCLTQKQEGRKDLTKSALMCFLQSDFFIAVLGIYLTHAEYFNTLKTQVNLHYT